ncbi:MAG: hypothetical protein ACLPVY_27890 [Acidimicrobiia bacterium]
MKEYLGHSSIRVTSDRYGHLFPKARASRADSLDETFTDSTKGDADITRATGFQNPANKLRTFPEVARLRTRISAGHGH